MKETLLKIALSIGIAAPHSMAFAVAVGAHWSILLVLTLAAAFAYPYLVWTFLDAVSRKQQ